MAAIPNKLFDVRSANNAVDADATVYPAATLIVFKDAASKAKLIDSFATAYNYQANIPDPANPGATIPNPQSKQGFFNARLTSFLKDVHASVGIQAASAAAAATASATATAELP